MSEVRQPIRCAYILCMETICDGVTPSWRDEEGMPVIYPTELDAQKHIAESQLELISLFLAGEMTFADALTVDDFVVPVMVWADGSITFDMEKFNESEDLQMIKIKSAPEDNS